MKIHLHLILFTVLAATLLSCEVETEFLTGNNVEIRFSADTISFDTVFTERGSATRKIKVYNDSNLPVMIDKVYIEGETGVTFIFNVDGFRGPEAEDVIIWQNDSIFLFVEVEIDPTEPENISPFIVEDFLVFQTGETRKKVALIAFGQNANYINNFNRGQFATISCSMETRTFPANLPIVIYGSLIIDSCILQVLPGTQIFVHGGVQRSGQVANNTFFNDGIIFTRSKGSIQFLGSQENPIIVRTDRLESEFEDQPGKYRGLVFGAGSRGNIVEHTQLLNSIIGITADSLSQVSIENSVIAYSAGSAISAYQADISIRNSILHSNFGNAIQFIKGGNLLMDHVTIANYGVDASSLVLTNFTCEDDVCNWSPMNARIRNSIISGSRVSELIFIDFFRGMESSFWNVSINNSVVRTDQGFLDSQEGLFSNFYTSICTECYNLESGDKLFIDIGSDDYQLDSSSVARDLGTFINSLSRDILNIERDVETPDAGALEWVGM